MKEQIKDQLITYTEWAFGHMDGDEYGDLYTSGELVEMYLKEMSKRNKSDKLNSIDIYPCTLVQDRYAGTYSGATWLAFNCTRDMVPNAVGSGDMEESEFWLSIDDDEEWIGMGS